MSRGAGFEVADVDVGILDDPKVRSLVRSTRDEALVARCLVAYLAVVTSSWDAGERVTLDDAAPLWLTAVEDLAERLAAAGLLDEGHRIPVQAWQSWYAPAARRRADRRFEGLVGGLMKSLNMDRPAAVAEARRRLATEALPTSGSGGPRSDLARSVPSSPSVPSEPSLPSPPPPTESVSAVVRPLTTRGHGGNGHGMTKVREEDVPPHLRAVVG